MRVSKSQFISTMFRMRGRQVSFEKHPYEVDMIDGTWSRKLYKCSRQVGKSSIICLDQGASVALGEKDVKDLRMTYVSPSWDQTKTFVVEKIRPILHEDSPRFSLLFTDKNSINEIKTQSFTNNALLFLRAAHWSAERVRGIPSDKVYLDELQSMLKGIIPVIASSLSASPVNTMTMAGTPLTEENPIEDQWRLSTQTEWIVPCRRHSPTVWNRPGKSNIGSTGLVCAKCGKLINTLEGRWYDMVPDAKIKGFHVSQLMTSLNQDPRLWDLNIVQPYENWEEYRFDNEVLGVSSGKSGRPFTIQILQDCCAPTSVTHIWDSSLLYEQPPTKKMRWFAGVDWGEGREEAQVEGGKKKNASFTHLIIGGFDSNQVFRVAHWKKFRGPEADPDFCEKYIVSKCREWGVERIALDYGFGWGINGRIRKAMPRQVLECMHSANLKELFKFDDISVKIILNRNAMITHLINDIKNQRVGFPKWQLFEPLSRDFLALYTEFNYQTNQIVFDHSIQEPDDGLHALLYAMFAAKLTHGIYR